MAQSEILWVRNDYFNTTNNIKGSLSYKCHVKPNHSPDVNPSSRPIQKFGRDSVPPTTWNFSNVTPRICVVTHCKSRCSTSLIKASYRSTFSPTVSKARRFGGVAMMSPE